MSYAVPLDLRLRNDHSVSDEDAPAVRCVVHHHHDTRLLAVDHAKCTAGGGERVQGVTSLQKSKRSHQDRSEQHAY